MDQKIVGSYLRVIKCLNYGKKEKERTFNTSVSLIRKIKWYLKKKMKLNEYISYPFILYIKVCVVSRTTFNNCDANSIVIRRW